MATDGLRVPPAIRRGRDHCDDTWLAAGRDLLDLVAGVAGAADLGGCRVLDVGCGTRFTQLLLDEGRPIGRYVGVDVEEQVVDFLRGAVDDPRFSFHHIDVQNDLYNPGGTPLADLGRLPVDEPFDVICLFSVFTHLAPHDFAAMLRLLREHATPDTRLVFSLFVNEWSTVEEAREGFLARSSTKLEQQLQDRLEADPAFREAFEQALRDRSTTRSTGPVPDFLDVEPDRPLLVAAYSEAYARRVVAEAGWRSLELRPPAAHVQHHFVCEPAAA